MVDYRTGQVLSMVYFAIPSFFVQAFPYMLRIYDPGSQGMGYFERHCLRLKAPLEMPSVGDQRL